MNQELSSCVYSSSDYLAEEVLNDVIEDPCVETTAEAVKESLVARLQELVG
jgi:hypothetical protein